MLSWELKCATQVLCCLCTLKPDGGCHHVCMITLTFCNATEGRKCILSISFRRITVFICPQPVSKCIYKGLYKTVSQLSGSFSSDFILVLKTRTRKWTGYSVVITLPTMAEEKILLCCGLKIWTRVVGSLQLVSVKGADFKKTFLMFRLSNFT